jgi:voltage-gated potassium channel Kch
LEAAGARQAKLLIIAIDEAEKITALVRIAKHNYPNLKLLVRAFDRAHAYEVLREGVDDVYREVFGSSMYLATDALVALGQSRSVAERAVQTFRTHDEKFLRKASELGGDQGKLIDLARQSRAEITNVFAADRENTTDKKSKND